MHNSVGKACAHLRGCPHLPVRGAANQDRVPHPIREQARRVNTAPGAWGELGHGGMGALG